jgi:uncharacterized phiE125 gp8 family phage protein
MIDWPAKEPTEVLDYTFDWTAALQESETVDSFTVTGTNVTVASSAEAAGIVTVRLSGGTEGSSARVTCTIVTDSVPARTFVETAVLPIGGGPVGLAAVKAYLAVDFDDHDSLIRSLICAAVATIERMTGKVLSPRVEEIRLKGFPATSSGRILLPRDPVQEIVSFTYLDQDAADAELVEADGEFRTVAGEPYLLFPQLGGAWPSALDEEGAVRIRALVGYEAGQVPGDLIAAVKMMVAHLFQNREGGAPPGQVAVDVPPGVAAFCFPHRRNLIG